MEFKIFIQFTLWNVIFHFVICKDFSYQPNYSLIILARVFSNNVYEKIMLILVWGKLANYVCNQSDSLICVLKLNLPVFNTGRKSDVNAHASLNNRHFTRFIIAFTLDLRTSAFFLSQEINLIPQNLGSV